MVFLERCATLVARNRTGRRTWETLRIMTRLIRAWCSTGALRCTVGRRLLMHGRLAEATVIAARVLSNNQPSLTVGFDQGGRRRELRWSAR